MIRCPVHAEVLPVPALEYVVLFVPWLSVYPPDKLDEYEARIAMLDVAI